MQELNSNQSTCEFCREVKDRTDIPHVVRLCEKCGRKMHIVEPGPDGVGLQIRAGDSLVIPEGWIKIALNPLKGSAHVTREGVDWFAQFVFVGDVFTRQGDYEAVTTELEQQMDQIVRRSPLAELLGLANSSDGRGVDASSLNEHQHKAEYWAFLTSLFTRAARDARREGDSTRACWATACAERSRSMLTFKEHIEEVVWIGQAARRLVDALDTWDSNRENDREEFWQSIFKKDSYVLSQVFAVPVVFIQDKAYVGGMNLDRSDAKFVDYVFKAESSQEAILVEIKTPVSKLLGREYRSGVHGPSVELCGSIVQVLTYRSELVRQLQVNPEGMKAFRPRCVLVIGNASEQLRDDDARRSFELFRSSCEVEIVTYDELFRKVEILAELFRLKRSPISTTATPSGAPAESGAPSNSDQGEPSRS